MAPQAPPAPPQPPPADVKPFPVPRREAHVTDTILVVVDPADRDPLLGRYLEVMRSHGHACEVLEVPGGDPHAARARIRAHPKIRDGSIRGIQIFGHTHPSFRLRYFYPGTTMDSRGASDLPYGSDFEFFNTPFSPAEENRSPAWNTTLLSKALTQPDANFEQSQWVARIFRLDDSYLKNLEETHPPQVNNMLIVNADPVFHDPESDLRIRNHYRARYSALTRGQVARFAFLEEDFEEGKLLPFLEANLENATFLSIADHGTSNNLVNLPPSQNGVAQLPRLPDVVEFAACAAGDWMEEEPPSISLAEAALRRGCLTVIGAQCLLAWYFTRGVVDLAPGTNPFDDMNQNPAPMLDIWRFQPSLGRAQAEAVTQALRLLKTSVYNEKPHIVFQVLCAHSLFGDGTVEFASTSFT